MSDLTCNIQSCLENKDGECSCETGEFKRSDPKCPSLWTDTLTHKDDVCENIEEPS
jgi:hypothetical protein